MVQVGGSGDSGLKGVAKRGRIGRILGSSGAGLVLCGTLAAAVFLVNRPEDKVTSVQPTPTRTGATVETMSARVLQSCGASLGSPTDVLSGLRVSMTVTIPNARPGETVEGSFVFANTGDAALSGEGAVQPVVTVAQAGRVVAMNNSLRSAALILDLEPGESRKLPLWFVAGECDPVGSGDGYVYAASHPLGPGRYDVFTTYSFRSGNMDKPLVAGPFSLTVT